MSLIEPILADYFHEALERSDTSLKPLQRVGMVGASTAILRDEKTNKIQEEFLEITEHDLLDAGHHMLARHGYGVGHPIVVYVSEYKRGSDFLNGAFRQAHIDFLVLSALFYDPKDLRPHGPMTHQSPHAADEQKWFEAFDETKAKAILNVF